MVGFRSTDAYSNAVVDNWLMVLDGVTLGVRMMGVRIEYNSVTAVVDIDGVLGGIGASVTRSATGLYQVVYDAKGDSDSVLLPFVAVGQAAHKAIVYSYSTTGCSIKTMSYAGAAWSLADIPFCLYVLGV